MRGGWPVTELFLSVGGRQWAVGSSFSQGPVDGLDARRVAPGGGGLDSWAGAAYDGVGGCLGLWTRDPRRNAQCALSSITGGGGDGLQGVFRRPI